MASAAATREEEEIFKEANKEAKLRLVSAQNAENAEKANKLASKYRKALELSQSEPNVVQVGLAVVVAGASSIGGYFTSKKIRAYTDEKKWVNQKGNRSIGAIMVGDILPAAFGFTIGIIGLFLKNGMVSAGVTGAGFGFGFGSVLHSLSVPKKP
jgi:hypothetical protein